MQKEMSEIRKEEVAREYCLYHELVRPKVKVATVLMFFLCLEILTEVSTGVMVILLGYLNIFFCFRTLYPVTGSVVFMLFFKKICILLILLYQRYAPEEMRRRCILMPTCSEYALLAIRKYGVIAGLYKVYVRLTRKCRGHVYGVDYP